MAPAPLELVLVDDHPLFSHGLELLLHTAAADRVHVAATTDRAELAVSVVAEHRPHVAVVDVAMPDPGGLAVMSAIKRRFGAEVHVLALSGVGDPDRAVAALRAGADGFVHKTADPTELVGPLLALVDGATVLPPDLLVHLLAADRATPDGVTLDEDERELWRLIALGRATAELAGALHVSERTVKRAVAALLRKIGATNRTHAAALAGRCGLLDEPA